MTLFASKRPETRHENRPQPTKGSRRKPGLTHSELLVHIETRCTPEPNTGCLLWTGAATIDGYGRIGWGKQASATITRVILGLEPGDAREALHICDQPACVNPAHLRIGSHAENQALMARGGRAATGPRNERRPKWSTGRWSKWRGSTARGARAVRA